MKATFSSSMVSIHFLFLIMAATADNPVFVKFTKITCTTLDKNWMSFERCAIKAVSRKLSLIGAKVHFKQLPFDTVSLRLALNYKANGWKPFMYDVTVDVCKFLKHTYNPIAKIFFCFIRDGFTGSWKCPITDTYMSVDNVTNQRVNECMNLPIPHGEYGLFTTWSIHNVTKFIVNAYVSIMPKAP